MIAIKIVQLLVLLPFYLASCVFGLIAGLIGGKTWHIEVSLRPNRGEPLVDYEIRL